MKEVISDRKTIRILSIGYIAIALIGAFLLTLNFAHKNHISFLDALFTSTSAISMTGLIVKNTATDFTFYGQMIILALIQIGGFGYIGIGLFIFIIVRKKIGFEGKNLLKESLIYPNMDGVLRFLKKIVIFVVLIEFIGAILLFFKFILIYDFKHALWHSIFHAISAFNNAGFSTFETGLVDFKTDLYVNLIITSLIITGGIGYFVILELYFFQKKRLANLSLHSKLVLSGTAILIIFATLLIFIFEYHNTKSIGTLSFFDKILTSYFTAVNYRTAGFNTIDLGALKDASLFFGSLFMIIGGAPGGTAGGIKITTIIVLFVYTYWIIKGGRIRVFSQEIPQETINKAFTITVSSIFYILVCVTLLSFFEDKIQFLPLLFETSSAFATVGVSIGNGGTLSLSALFSTNSKILIIILMMSGRIGIYAFFLLIFRQEKEKFIKYPQGKVYL
ncbi:TRK system potassium uptake protein TrkB [Campylobacter sputorum subsp. bubulus]|uniref:TRK system potassium uptake protein TrkB n=1 Tax=Campylobacter sputorum subsp. sputorum TaxID=32024 RepID=A0A381DKX3_9BACT|nr:TrkH family potassium uptake protein [Campylobacter sputorum]ASM34611.1 potassium transporter KtrAB, KtrB subunit [Campylobacter sputorum aubsp. sputorum RM3237]ASM36275.1 potassium transporter KtrAB, KtrB subunit [Campylobacter sputorum bv. faecalis CCUG 20703]ASM37955.1 potassium transporter KtrAB, KtrB subunit [Campylobacter sputorum bv. paraureolyticus LMG 11764]KAB0581173.1 potassium transporter [Campylobacter sputorum subsp. sputorum]MDY6121075.1 TrkH family potassium uptake protein [